MQRADAIHHLLACHLLRLKGTLLLWPRPLQNMMRGDRGSTWEHQIRGKTKQIGASYEITQTFTKEKPCPEEKSKHQQKTFHGSQATNQPNEPFSKTLQHRQKVTSERTTEHKLKTTAQQKTLFSIQFLPSHFDKT